MFLSINNFELSVFGPTANITSVKPPFGVNCFGSFFWILVVTFLRSINNILELPLLLKEPVLTQLWVRGISCRTESWSTAQKLKMRWFWVQDQKPSTSPWKIAHFTLWPSIVIIWSEKFQLIRIFDHSFHNIMTTETDFSLSFLGMISHFRNICELDTSIRHWNTDCTIFKTIICKHCSATSCTIFGLTITFDKVNTSYFTDKPLKTSKVSDVKLLSVYIRFLWATWNWIGWV